MLLEMAWIASFAAAAPAATPEQAYAGLDWRFMGPFRGGWATVAAGVPGDPTTFYFGSADGGVWKTTDAGVTWRPVFEGQGSASIGALAVAPSDPRTLWVGTGQVNQRWDIVDGDGVYRSTDAGATWQNVGLRETRHVGQVWVDPRDARVAVVAALGHVFGPNPERGLYRTEDGGKTWSHVLDRGPDVGAVDIASDLATPDVLYASLWQVRRHPWLDYFQPPVGPGSGIVKSKDGGRTWTAAGSKGLPGGPMGRIDLGVAPGMQARRVFAGIDTDQGQGGGLYRSDDGGESWTRVNPETALANSYMNCITPDPKDPEVVWAAGRGLRRSTDGGKSFSIAKGSPGGDDYHHLWVDPGDPRRMITAADQGAVLTLNGGASWSSWYNQPTGQFYRLAADDRFPYRVYSGQQDSGTVALQSRSDYGQLTFRDWNPVGADERDGDVPDPADPDVVYGAGLGGRLSRWDARTGQVQNVSPWPVSSYGVRPTTVRYRYSWITPLAISPRPPHAIYQGAQVLFRSTDKGRSWQTVSPDLTGAAAGTKGCEGDVPVDRASACGYGVIFAIAPSPAADGLAWIGTDNGRVQLTRDDGKTWTDVTPPGLKDWTKVNTIDASASDPGTAYVAADRHRLDDFRPLAFRTHDFGATWTEIGHGLPDGAWVGVVRADPKRPGLLFAGTSRGVHVSFDDGERWQGLQLDLPRTGINDLIVHGDDVIVATQGRGIWALDQIQPLRHLTAAALAEGPLLVPPPTALRLRPNQNKDTPLPPEEPRAPNPPLGAILDYVLPEAPTGPVVIEIAGPDGVVVRRFASDEPVSRPRADVYFADLWLKTPPAPSARAGHNRFVWNLRYAPPRAVQREYSMAAVPEQPWTAHPEGAFVLPGTYEVRLTVDGTTRRQPLTVAMEPRVGVDAKDLETLLAFQREVESALASSAELHEKLKGIQEWLRASLDDKRASAERRAIERTLLALDPLSTGEGRPERVNAVLASLATDLEAVDAAPTGPQRELLASSREAIARFAERWKAFASGPLAAVERRLLPRGLRRPS